jgi:hypothetical protein
MTMLDGQATYVEYGGRFLNNEAAIEEAHAGFFAVATQPGKATHTMVAVPDGKGVPATTLASMACSPKGDVYLFGGLVAFTKMPSSKDEVPEITWAPTAALYSLQLTGSSSKPSLGTPTELAAAAKRGAAPGPRSSHAMVYLPKATVSSLGLAGDALLLYGGSDVNQTQLSDLLEDETAAAAVLNTTDWDTTAWLYDIAADKWIKLAPVGGLPPGLMYHSMAVEGKQVRQHALYVSCLCGSTFACCCTADLLMYHSMAVQGEQVRATACLVCMFVYFTASGLASSLVSCKVLA